jgi:hypothetical protein
MDAFIKVIDSVGGVDINVENTFCDAGYPLKGDSGIETLQFFKGDQHMDGTTALKFARSRVHNQCSDMTSGSPVFEGTDFRRAYRQQQVIKALESKIKSGNLDLDKIQQIIQAVGNNILTHKGKGPMSAESRFDLETIKAGFDLRNQIKVDTQNNFVISPTSCNGNALKVYNEADGYFIIPIKSHDFSNLQSCVEAYLINPALFSEKSNIQVYNTGIGNAKATALNQTIADLWLNSNFAGNLTLENSSDTDRKDLSHGIYIVDLNDSNKETVNFLKDKLKANIIQKSDLPKTVSFDNTVDIAIFASSN